MDLLKPLVISIIRTVIMPLVAGGLLSLIVLAGVTDPSAEVRAAVASLLAVAWYLAARFLESKNRYWGLLLLVAVEPTYDPNTESNILTTIESNIVMSVQRTVVPLAVGWLITLLARQGFSLDSQTLTVALQAGITSVYYGAIRLIEESKPQAGVLIGGAAPPTY